MGSSIPAHLLLFSTVPLTLMRSRWSPFSVSWWQRQRRRRRYLPPLTHRLRLSFTIGDVFESSPMLSGRKSRESLPPRHRNCVAPNVAVGDLELVAENTPRDERGKVIKNYWFISDRESLVLRKERDVSSIPSSSWSRRRAFCAW